MYQMCVNRHHGALTQIEKAQNSADISVFFLVIPNKTCQILNLKWQIKSCVTDDEV